MLPGLSSNISRISATNCPAALCLFCEINKFCLFSCNASLYFFEMAGDIVLISRCSELVYIELSYYFVPTAVLKKERSGLRD